MPANECSGPKLSQLVFYLDATFGKIPAMITQVNATTGLVTLTTFPPGVAPQNQTSSQYDYTGTIVGSWRYPEIAVQ